MAFFPIAQPLEQGFLIGIGGSSSAFSVNADGVVLHINGRSDGSGFETGCGYFFLQFLVQDQVDDGIGVFGDGSDGDRH